ncbi:MAG TPA: CPBP family intramembrane glutamic endopeptidase [Rhizomicrobium sp.]|nr:CPBP family intramembrane glutamic endopeptidase [Rhizomicrobium sp.]
MAMPHLAPGQTPFDLLLVAYAVIGLPIVSTLNGRRIARDPSPPLVPRYLRTMLRGWLTAAAAVLCWWYARRPFAALGFDVPLSDGGRWGALVAALAIVAVAVIQLRLSRLMTAKRQDSLRKQAAYIKILPRTTPELLLFFGVSITAGVWEETLYRGFLIWFASTYLGVVGAVVATSVVFGVGHAYQGWRGATNAGLLGLGFAIGFALTGSLWWLIVVHALVDVFGGLTAWRAMRITPRAA